MRYEYLGAELTVSSRWTPCWNDPLRSFYSILQVYSKSPHSQSSILRGALLLIRVKYPALEAEGPDTVEVEFFVRTRNAQSNLPS